MTKTNKPNNKKRTQQKTLFDEWQMMNAAVTEFRDLVWQQPHDDAWERLDMFAVGFPRNFKVVATLQRDGIKFRKVMTMNIQWGSPETWFAHWDREHWYELEI